jgi:hypothetical protein
MKKLNCKYYKMDGDFNLKSIGNVGKKLKYSLGLNFILLIAVILLSQKEPIIQEIHHHTRDTITVGDIALNDSSITEELIKNKCILPSVAVAQAKVESANYKSPVCKENKNLFGIKWHKCDYVLGEHRNHASYKSYKDNIKCYVHIQNKYLRNINGRYAEATGYVDLLKSMQK